MNKKGFTLIEIMVAVSIFSIVAVIISGALITAMSISRQAQATKLVVDNLNFAMDSMIVSLRDGKFFECKSQSAYGFSPSTYNSYNFSTYTGETSALSCSGGGAGIVFSRKRLGVNEKVAYRFNQTKKSIEYAVGTGAANFVDMTSPEVEITSMRFRVIDATGSPGSGTFNPRLLLSVSGQTKDKTQTKFYLQTSVAARQ